MIGPSDPTVASASGAVWNVEIPPPSAEVDAGEVGHAGAPSESSSH
jgi:hypothetical protein